MKARRGLIDVVVELPNPALNVSLLHPLAAAAASEAVRKDTGLVTWVGWPDLVLADGKALGVTSVSHRPLKLEVTMNCFAPGGLLPGVAPSTSILEVLGVEVDTGLLRDRVIAAVDWYAAEWERGAYRELAQRIQPSIYWMGEEVEVTMKDGTRLTGRAKGMDERGRLQLEAKRRRATLALSPEEVDSVVQIRQSPHRGSTGRNLL